MLIVLQNVVVQNDLAAKFNQLFSQHSEIELIILLFQIIASNTDFAVSKHFDIAQDHTNKSDQSVQFPYR